MSRHRRQLQKGGNRLGLQRAAAGAAIGQRGTIPETWSGLLSRSRTSLPRADPSSHRCGGVDAGRGTRAVGGPATA